MSARRLLTAIVALAWFLPTLAGAATALHVAFEHPAGGAHEATAHLGYFAPSREGARCEAVGSQPHSHSAAVLGAVNATRPLTSPSAHEPAAGGSSSAWLQLEAQRGRAAETRWAESSRANGPPLLACLSTLRI